MQHFIKPDNGFDVGFLHRHAMRMKCCVMYLTCRVGYIILLQHSTSTSKTKGF